jgi:hypothetical protein
VLVRQIRARIKSNVLAGAIQVQSAGGGKATREGGFASELMRQLLLLGHFDSMRAGRRKHAFVKLQGRGSDSRAGVIRQIEQSLLGLWIVIQGGLIIRGNGAI